MDKEYEEGEEIKYWRTGKIGIIKEIIYYPDLETIFALKIDFNGTIYMIEESEL